jgi:mono/diheme cytochrome c family protein
MFWMLLFMMQAAPQTQIERGEALFNDTANGCVSCHMLKGKGTPAGPDLKGVAHLTPPGIAMAIRSTVTQYVQIAKLKGGGSFPTMVPTQSGDTLEIYDLSKNPPEAMKVAKSDVSFSPNNNWKHPPGARKYTKQQMADLIAYIRFAGANNRGPVDPEDIP